MKFYGLLDNHKLIIENQVEAKEKMYPLVDCELAYDGSIWEKGYAPQPTVEEQNEAIRQTRQQLFTKQADPLKLDYDEALARYGETDERTVEAKNIWLDKKDEIRENNPYISN